jgi:hypothetical protein
MKNAYKSFVGKTIGKRDLRDFRGDEESSCGHYPLSDCWGTSNCRPQKGVK